MIQEIKDVAVIGAGISGVVSDLHLKAAGVNVTVFERSSTAGGVWYVCALLVKDLYLFRSTSRFLSCPQRHPG